MKKEKQKQDTVIKIQEDLKWNEELSRKFRTAYATRSSFPHKKRIGKDEKPSSIPLSSPIALISMIHHSCNSKPSTLQVSLSTNEAIRAPC